MFLEIKLVFNLIINLKIKKMSIKFFNITFTKSKNNNLFIFRLGKYITITNL